ncbi:MAG: hypothetical protein COA49_08930 [Bacteroidetes bacterium]|nr:MAG: hypothetical protein COA49_08930 [Bacteroidota bacterium]
MDIKADKVIEKVLVSGLFITVVSLPWSPFGTSMGMGLLGCAWVLALIQGKLIFPKNKMLCGALAGLFVWHVIGLLWTENLVEGLATLQIKLPILIVPLSLMTVPWRKDVWMSRLLSSFVFSTALAALSGLLLGGLRSYLGADLHPSEWSPFISHIRMGILLAISQGGLIIYSLRDRRFIIPTILYAVIACSFIWQTQTVTGAGMMGVAILYGLTHKLVKGSVYKVIIIISVATAALAIVIFATIFPGAPPSHLPSHTRWGAPYIHMQEKVLEENGNKVWNNLAWAEAKPEWNKRSTYDFNGNDDRGQEIKITLSRYLTSMGLPKDGYTVRNLSDEDVHFIELGHSSINEESESGMSLRIDALRYEIGNWLDGGNPSGNSVTQRVIYFKTGLHILFHNDIKTILLGVGTGDLPDAFSEAYKELDTKLKPQFRHRTHNQYLAWWIAGGVFALVLWLLVLIFSWKRDEMWLDVGRLTWWAVALSCIAEDTLETQAGVTFAVFSIVLFSINTGTSKK